MSERLQQFRAEGVCGMNLWADPVAFREFMKEGDRHTDEQVRAQMGAIGVQVQGRVETFEARLHDPTNDSVLGGHRCGGACVWVKTTRNLAERCHVLSYYAIAWRR